MATALELFGGHFYHYCVKHGFGEMLVKLGHDMESLLQGLDYHHYFLSNFIYGSLNAPSFRCEKVKEGLLHLHYYSSRKSLYPVVAGRLGHSGCF